MISALTLQELYRPIETELDQVRMTVAEVWTEALALVDGGPFPQWDRGGKLLRPALALLSSGASGASDVKEFVSFAAGMELIHLAALAHDDVVDGSHLRRGAQSLNAYWDNHAAVLGGDYIVARAISMVSDYGSADVIGRIMNTIREMAAAELIAFGTAPTQATAEWCMDYARRKTAGLFEAACSLPAQLISGEPDRALAWYGRNLGIAFQLVDDILDLCQDEDTLGKPACNDVANCRTSLPILLLRQALDERGTARLDHVSARGPSEGDRLWIAETLESTGARERAEAIARNYAEHARVALNSLPCTPYCETLAGLTEFVVTRGS